MKKDYSSSWFPWRQENRLKKMLLSISFIFLALTSFGQIGTIQIGSGTATSSGGSAIPITNFDYNYSQQIVTGGEYVAGGGAAGNITKIRYYFTATGTLTNWNNWTVYLGNTTKTSFSSMTDWVPLAELTEVFNGTISPVADQWYEITFTAPFNYTGGNLVVAVDENTPNWQGGPTIRSYTSASNTGILYRADGATNNPDPAAPPSASSRSGVLPQLQFEGTLASCPPPLALTASSITTTSATLAWSHSGTATDFDIEYGIAGFVPTGTPTLSMTTNPTTISLLSPSTTYQYYVRAVCGTTDFSGWNGPFSFTTLCEVADTPFFEGFENGYTNNAEVVGCWSQEIPSTVTWTKKWQASNSTTNTMRDPRTGGWNSTLGWNGNSWLFRGMNLTAGTQYLVKFYARQDGSTPANANIEASFGSAATAASMTDVVIVNTGLTNGQYQEFIGYYTPTTSGVYYLGIQGYINITPNYIALDDISVEIAPACAAPTALTASNITATTANLAWTENGTATDWEIKYGVTGFDLATASAVSVTDNPYLLSGLTPFTTYEYYVRTVCGLSDESSWAGPFSFTTTCEVATIPFFEGFETGYTENNAVEGCWIQELASTSTKRWTANNTNTTYNRTPRTGAWDATLGWGANAWMIRGMNLDAGSQYFIKFYARQDGSIAANASIEAFFGTSSNAASMTNTVIASTGLINGEYQEFTGYFTPTTSGVYYLGIHGVISSAPYYITLDDISVEIAPTCPAPVAITASNITPTSAELAWTESGSSTDWEIQYGLAGFALNTGTIIETNLNPHEVTGLQPATMYHFYVRTICSLTDSSTWSGPYTVSTACAPITALPWTESFDNMQAIGDGIFPLCWVDETPGDWSTTNAAASNITSGPLSGSNYLRVQYYTDSRVWTPEFELVAGETYEFSFNWGADNGSGWEGTVFVNNAQVAAGATQIGPKFVEIGDATSTAYQKETYCFTPTTSGVYTFGINVVEDDFQYYMSFDDFSLKQVVTVPGTDGSLTVCQTGSLVDLNDVITTTATDGTWNFDLNPNAVNTAGMFNAASVPSGVHNFLYITAGCAPDTTIATITIVQPSSAGNDGSIAVCRNQPFSLLSGLTGNADFGGVWTDPNAVVVPNGNAISSNIPGQYNYKYIVTNGVCPADTAKVVVNVQGCDYSVGIDDVVFEGFNMYPNPTSDVLFISNTGSTEVFNYEVLDMNGRVILKANKVINGSSTTELNLSNVETGVYLVRVFNEQAEKTFRVVKN